MSKTDAIVAVFALAVWGLTVTVLGQALARRWSRAAARTRLRTSVDALHARFARVEVALDDVTAELARIAERDHAFMEALHGSAHAPAAVLQARREA
jgi:hypothetical protein